MAAPRYLITRVRYLCRVAQIARPFSRVLSTALFTLASCVFARSLLVFAAFQRGSIMRGESNHANQQRGVGYDELSFVSGYLVFWLLVSVV